MIHFCPQIFVIAAALIASCWSCQYPTSIWCSSEEIAKKCQVEEQCRYHMNEKAERVQLTLYYESLCPDCKQFITDQLYPTWKQINQIIDLTLVPYGNAEETRAGNKWKFECQHGSLECYGNVVETCAIYLMKNITNYFPFIHCIEASQSEKLESVIKECAVRFHVDLNALHSCASSSLGNRLEHEMALKTDALSPQHQYVPWITLNGVHTEDLEKKAEADLLGLICDTYKGPKPYACKKSPYNKCPKL